jgi:integrase
MKHAQDGFPHYRERGYLLSQSLAKGFKVRGLMPSDQHRIYSFRHSFEKRMLEAGIDYGLRCTLMGHRNPRPEYGDGGSLGYRRNELLKIAYPVSDELLASFPFREAKRHASSC